MKRKTTKTLVALSLLCALSFLVFIIRRYDDRPILKRPLQGGDLVSAVEREFEFPIDPMAERPGVFLAPFPYWRGLNWNAGTEMTICGVVDTRKQDMIADFVKREVRDRGLCDVELVFEEMAKIKKEGRLTSRIQGPEIRRMRIKGVTKSWRELQAELESQQASSSNGG